MKKLRVLPSIMRAHVCSMAAWSETRAERRWARWVAGKALVTAYAVFLVFWAALPLRARAADEAAKPAPPKVIPVFSLDRSLQEAPVGDDFLFAAGPTESFQQLLARLKKACGDQQVPAVILAGNSTGLGTAQLEEVRQAIDQLKAAGKQVCVHTESLSMRSYVLFSGASRISVVPTGDLWLTGIRGESLHIRGLLDKIGVEPDYLTCGAYKSAGEMFTHHEPSREAAENLRWLLDGFFESYVQQISQGRNVTPETVRQWMDRGLFSAAEAQRQQVIDAVEYHDEFLARLKAQYGEKVKFDRSYGKTKKGEIDFSSPFGVLKFYAELLAGPKSEKTGKPAVAIVCVEGPILAGKPDPSMFPFSSQGLAFSSPIRSALDKAAADDSIKAVVLRVNSPGGSAVGSEVILQATRRLKAKKPLTVSMGDIAGSGGYYVACGADTIFADPSTITASIGVVAGKLVTRTMWDRVGIRWVPFDCGESAGLLGSDARFSDRQRKELQSWMNEVYAVFKGHVTAIRRERLKKDLEEMAGGRVFTGRQALQLGLVDQLGGLYDAVRYAAKQAGVEDYELRVLPRPKGFADLLRESLTGEESDEQTLAVPAFLVRPASSVAITDLALAYLKGIEPARLKYVRQALLQMEILQQERVSLAMPIFGFGD